MTILMKCACEFVYVLPVHSAGNCFFRGVVSVGYQGFPIPCISQTNPPPPFPAPRNGPFLISTIIAQPAQVFKPNKTLQPLNAALIKAGKVCLVLEFLLLLCKCCLKHSCSVCQQGAPFGFPINYFLPFSFFFYLSCKHEVFIWIQHVCGNCKHPLNTFSFGIYIYIYMYNTLSVWKTIIKCIKILITKMELILYKYFIVYYLLLF